MNTIYDRLKHKLQVQRREGGISPLELAELPPKLKKVMRLLIREMELSYPELCQAILRMPAADQLPQVELDEALAILTQQNWLKRDFDRGVPLYKVNLRRKAGSALPAGIWSDLHERLQMTSKPENSDQSQAEK